MSMPQVGAGAVAIVPTFRGFRRGVDAEVDASAKSATRGFRTAFSKTGTASGAETGRGFKKAFNSEATGFSARATRELEQSVSKAARVVSQARLKEQDATGKVRVAEAQLAEARRKYSSDASQVIRAEERLATASRQLQTAQSSTKESTDDLRAAQARLATAADRAGDELEEAGRRSGSRFSNGFRGVFGGAFAGSLLGNLTASLTGGITSALETALRAGIDYLGQSTIAASSLNESLNAVAVAYGTVGDEIIRLGEDAPQRLGLSSLEFNEFATQFSAFASTIRGSDMPGFINDLTERGADFASVFNIEVADALGLFQSGLAGETEPLRRYGIDLSAATVEAYAYANGIGVAGQELSEAQKQQARYGALIEQTNKVQGDFSNTSGELANQQRILAAEWENSQARLGMALLPALTQLANVANDSLVPALNQVIDRVGPQLGSALEDSIPSLVELIETTAEYLPQLIEMGATALPLVLATMQALIPVLQFVAENQAGVLTVTQLLFDLLNGDASVAKTIERLNSLGGVWGWVRDIVISAAQGTVNAAGLVVGAVERVRGGVDQAVGFFTGLPERALSALGSAGETLYSSGQALIGGFIDGIKSMLKPVGDAVGGVVEWARGFFPNSPAKRGPLSGAGWRRLADSGGAVMEQWTTGFYRPDLSGAISTTLASVSAAPASGEAAGAGPGWTREGNQFIQNLNVQHMPPEEAVELGAQRMASVARRSP